VFLFFQKNTLFQVTQNHDHNLRSSRQLCVGLTLVISHLY